MKEVKIRLATINDLEDVLSIYNEGIEDRIATLEMETKDLNYMFDWFHKHQERYKTIVAELYGDIIGWASLNQYNSRKAYDGVADLSVYIKRSYRGKGIGGKLLSAIEIHARENEFNKIVLSTFPFNQLGQGLYRKKGFREVGVFEKQGKLDGEFVDVMVMEKLLF
ncbi:arsinothricin resistance N-acetyltransferase ArsN1 family A [Heyndrickxia vini]|uniref:N-acetyltransferase n=1 Tax=Heyndrickxia vini TaxID=1476025 RepID=A0ABX7E2Z0_9BACI|nr:arsinothricin resistance N-acetyltransferase ArsN1 family A [Heyndrickxia vini]QQZ09611.1 N-acetyltransferase [Heyndrickxia vini]